MVGLTIDGVEVEAPAGELLIKAAEDNGVYIPRFCWHPRMNPVGMCRMCMVEIETPRGRIIVPSCVQPVNDGMVAYTESEPAKKAQEGVLEFLLANHPLDCPVCDKGGECPLQDQTMSYGPGESRFVEEKRHFAKPVPISDLVLLDRERCILCARCTRFSDEISGDPLIEFQGRSGHTQVLTGAANPRQRGRQHQGRQSRGRREASERTGGHCVSGCRGGHGPVARREGRPPDRGCLRAWPRIGQWVSQPGGKRWPLPAVASVSSVPRPATRKRWPGSVSLRPAEPPVWPLLRRCCSPAVP